MLFAVMLTPVAVWGLVWCLREPMRIALPIFAALVPYGSGLSLGSSRFGSLSSIAGLVLGAGLVLQLVTGRKGATHPSYTVPVWILFVGTALLTVLWSIDRSASISSLLVLVSLVVVYVLTTISRADRDILRRAENALLVGGVSVVMYGIAELTFLGGLPTKSAGGAADAGQGRFGDNLLGANIEAVALLYPLVVALTRFMDPGRRRRWWYLAAAVLMLVGVFMTGSRGGLLATGISLVTMTFAGPHRIRRPMLAVIGLGVVLATYVYVLHPFGIAERTYASPTSSSGRTDIWQVGLASCPQYCTFGAGWGTFPDVYAATQAQVPSAAVLVGTGASYQPHNVWLLAIVEAGLPGVLLLSLGLLISAAEGLALPVRLRAPPLAALFGLMFAVVLLSSLEFKCFWMVLMMVSISRNVAIAEKAPRELVAVHSGGRRPRHRSRSATGRRKVARAAASRDS